MSGAGAAPAVGQVFGAAWPVRRFDLIDSTNEEARRLAQAGDLGPAWLTAAQQSAGRGRQGREWASPTGNLYATALFAFPGPMMLAPLACFSAGLALIDAAEALGLETHALRLKWPNDVEALGAKLAGILIETGSGPGKALWMAAGFGVNVEIAPERPDRPTARLRDLPGGSNLTPATLLRQLDIAFRARLARLVADGFAQTRLDWLARAGHVGAMVRVKPASGEMEGRMVDMDEDGALVLELAGGAHHRVRAGEITVVG